jgi:hypothetical protein
MNTFSQFIEGLLGLGAEPRTSISPGSLRGDTTLVMVRLGTKWLVVHDYGT